MLGSLAKLKSPKTENDPDEAVRKLESGLLPDEHEHYVWMEWRFNSARLWVWWLNLAVYIGIVTAYFLIDGHEIIYSMYLPLDLLLNLAKAAYYFYYLFEEK